MSGHGVIRRLWELFDRYDEQAAEFMRREGVDVEAAWPHVEQEGRPE